jgi:hypothetical protein
MKKNPIFVALGLLIFPLAASADTFKLKDGSSLEGRIISDEGDSYLLEVLVTKSIKDERKVAKADVVKIEHEQPDLKAFESIVKLVPTPDLLTVDDYGMRIAAVQKFLKDHGNSRKINEAKAILETLKTESSTVSAGGLKLNDKIISPEEYLTNGYDLDARVQEAKIRRLVYGNKFLEALRMFADFDRDYRTTLSYGTLQPLMKQVIQNQGAEAKQLLQSYDTRVKDRTLGLERIATENRKAIELAIQEEAAELEARYKAEKDAKQGWVTPHPFHKASLEETVRFGATELTRLATVKTTLGVEGGKAYRDLYNAVQSGGNAATVSAAVTAAKTAAVPPRYLAPLEEAAKGRK